MTDPMEQFRRAIEAAGLPPPETITADGSLHRFPTNGRCGDDSGWYVFHANGIAAGCFGDWRTGISQTWRGDPGRALSPAEAAAYHATADAMHRERKAEDARRRAEAKTKAAAVWKAATPATADHRYLARKRVAPVASLREIEADQAENILGYRPQAKGEPLVGRLLLVPVKVANSLSTLEMIDETGRKSALFGGVKAGGYWAAQPLPEGDGSGHTFHYCEGVTTTLSAGSKRRRQYRGAFVW